MKEKRQEANKKYRLKKKEEMNVCFIEKPEISIEEKIKKIEKQKDKRQEYNKKYYLKKKEEINVLKPSKPILTHTEKRKLWNKKYYQSKKELIAQLATLTEKS
jgi:hypothetical protein